MQESAEQSQDAITEEEISGAAELGPKPAARNAFTELMSSKDKVSKVGEVRPPKRKLNFFSGRDGLGEYTRDPTSFDSSCVIYFNDDFVVINDMYPKSSVHTLLLPRSPRNLLHPFEAFEDLEFLKKVQEETYKLKGLVAKELRRRYGKYSAKDQMREKVLNGEVDLPEGEDLPEGRDWEKDVMVGIHAHPSMNHLHVHVLSIDRFSECLKHRKHYNSFATPFLIDVKDFPLAKDDPRRHPGREGYLDRDLRCWRCGKNFGNKFARLKEHLAIEFKEWRAELSSPVQMSTGEPLHSISTRFLVISDTHNFKFENIPKYGVTVSFQHPVPRADVVIHCGDLTMRGGAKHYRDVIEMLGSLDAELKLVIAGNHDVDLDKDYWRDSDEPYTEPDEHDEAMEVMTGLEAVEKGIRYLEEGLHSFTLKNGAKFTVYASPYQPEFCRFAFPYLRHQDRFNLPEQAAKGVTSIAKNPVPDFPGVDIMMTHGPPRGIMDKTDDGFHAGCDNLLRAAARARPRMYCFGHIHEGYGLNLVTWKPKGTNLDDKQVEQQSRITNTYPNSNKASVRFGEETLMVNAAIMNIRYRPRNAPWLIDLDLPVASDVGSGI
ncbi:hypothetical protein B7463_g10702, partial [Scytalidium lignicola]